MTNWRGGKWARSLLAGTYLKLIFLILDNLWLIVTTASFKFDLARLKQAYVYFWTFCYRQCPQPYYLELRDNRNLTKQKGQRARISLAATRINFLDFRWFWNEFLLHSASTKLKKIEPKLKVLSYFEQLRKSICLVKILSKSLWISARIFKRSFSKRLLNAKPVFLDHVMSGFNCPSQGSSPETDNNGNYKAKNCWNLSSSIPHFKSIWIQEAESVFLTVSERVLLIVGQIIHKSCTRLVIYVSYFCLFIILLNLFPHSHFVVKTCVAKNHVRGLIVKAKQERYILHSNPSWFERTVELRWQNHFNFTFRAPNNDNILTLALL